MPIPENEFTIHFVRSSGPGGQNVNKLSTKAQVHWSVGSSHAFTPEQKWRIRGKLKNRLTVDDEIVVACSAERSQDQNRQRAISILNSLVEGALRVPKKRIPTRPTKTSKEKRLQSKILRGRIKRLRRAKIED